MSSRIDIESYFSTSVGEMEVGYTIQLGYIALREDHHGPHRESLKFLWDLKVSGTVKGFG